MINRSDARDYEFHLAVVAKLRENPDRVMRRALDNLRRWQESGGTVPAYMEWAVILKNGRAAVEAVLLDEGNLGQRLRSSSPFYGILTEQERMDALGRDRGTRRKT